MKHIFPIIFLPFILLISCTPQKNVEEIESGMKYASLLQIKEVEDGVTLCRIKNPWKRDELLAQYLLLSNNQPTEDYTNKFGKSVIIKTPLGRVTLGSSCHGYLLHVLGAIENVAAMCETEYVAFLPIKQRISDNKVIDAGSSMSPNIEAILAAGSDAIWLSPFESQLAFPLSPQTAAILPVIYAADYMETSPLGRAEWMKFYGRLVGKEQEADSLFCEIEERYNSYKSSLQGKEKLRLLCETPYQGTWFVPGGESTMGILYHDAGYDYPWGDDNHAGSLALSQEEVLTKAQDADVWVIKYFADHDFSLEEFLGQNPYFPQFKAAQTGNIFGCNTKTNDYYDVTPFRPDTLLQELQALRNNSGRKQCYFQRLK